MLTPKIFDEIFAAWQERELKYQSNNKRKYLHFDPYIRFHKNIKWFESYFRNSAKNVSKHAFYPFIKSDIITPRIKHEKDQNGKRKPVLTKKVRPISYASHFDSFIYSWYTSVLTYFYFDKIKDLKIEDCVLAYLEKGKNNIHYANEVFDFIKKKNDENGQCVALAFDLTSFFDGLDHEILKSKWCKILDIQDGKLPKDHFVVYKSLTDYSYVLKEDLEIRFPIPVDNDIRMDRFCTPKQFRDVVVKDNLIQQNPNYNKVCSSKKYGIKCGIPQGSPISACLSNIYLIDFDQLLLTEAESKNALYRRYCDDLIIVCNTEDEEYFHELITNSIKQYEVVVNADKTEITYFKPNVKGNIRGFRKDDKYKSLQYLGFEFNGQNIYIRSSSMSRYHNRMSSKVAQAIHDAYDKDFGQKDFIFRKQLYQRFTHKGSRNFITYAKRAYKVIMKSETIRRQVKNSIEKVEDLIDGKRGKVEKKKTENGRQFKNMK